MKTPDLNRNIQKRLWSKLNSGESLPQQIVIFQSDDDDDIYVPTDTKRILFPITDNFTNDTYSKNSNSPINSSTQINKDPPNPFWDFN